MHVGKELEQRSLVHNSNRFDFNVMINRYNFAEVDPRLRVQFILWTVKNDFERVLVHLGLFGKLGGSRVPTVHNRMCSLIDTLFGSRLARIRGNGTFRHHQTDQQLSTLLTSIRRRVHRIHL